MLPPRTRALLGAVCLAVLLPGAASAAPSQITTIAGDTARPGAALERGMSPQLALRRGDVTYISDTVQNVIWARDDDGTVRVAAGSGERCSGTLESCGIPGPAGEAELSVTGAMAFDPDGSLFVAVANALVRIEPVGGRITPASPVTRVAGNGTPGADGDNGPAGNARVGIRDLAFDPAGNLYLAELFTYRLRRIVAGPDARIQSSDQIGAIVGTGSFCTPAGNTDTACGYGGPASAVKISDPYGITFDPAGNLYIADSRMSVVLRVTAVGGAITPASTVDRIAGDSSGAVCALAQGGCGDGGPATSARFASPGAVADGPSALAVVPGFPLRVLVADIAGRRVRMFEPGGTITTVAGSTACPDPFAACGSGGPATAAQYAFVSRLSRAPDGSVLLTERSNEVHRISVTGGVPDGASTSTTIAGTGAVQAGCDAFAACPEGRVGLDAPLRTSVAAAVAPNGTLYTVDQRASGSAVRRHATDGTVTTIAGDAGQCPDPQLGCGDGGPAGEARFRSLSAIAVDAQGRVLVADVGGSRVRRIAAGDDGTAGSQNTIATVVGGGSPCAVPDGPCGDGSAAGAAQISPSRLALNARGDLYVGDGGVGRVRRVVAADGAVSSQSRIETVLGTGAPCGQSAAGVCGEGGPASAARIDFDVAIAVTATGDLVALRGNRLLRVTAGDGVAEGSDTVDRLNPGASACGGGVASCGDGGDLANAGFTTGFYDDLRADRSGGVYVLMGGVPRVRRILPVGGTATAGSRIEAFAGSGLVCDAIPSGSPVASCGDGGPAPQARLSYPIAVAPSGYDLLVVERRRVRKVERTAPPGVALSVAPGTGAGPLAVTFSTATVPTGGPVTSWRLSFGDGTPDAAGSGAPPATIAHTYPDGAYTARLTVTDDLTDAASATAAVVAGDDDAPSITALSAAPSTFRVAPASGPTGTGAGTTIGFDLGEPATYTATLVQGTRTVLTLGTAAAGPGRTSLAFRGRNGARPLAPGRYAVTVTARDPSGNTSAPASTPVTITGPSLTVAVRRRSLQTAIRSRGILVAMKCAASACTVNASVKLGKKTLGKVRKSLPSGRSTLVRIPLSRTGLTAIRKKRTIRITVPVTATDPGGNAVRKTAKATVKRAR